MLLRPRRAAHGSHQQSQADIKLIAFYTARQPEFGEKTTMDAAELRQMQAPIKERYKTDPKAAMITLNLTTPDIRACLASGG